MKSAAKRLLEELPNSFLYTKGDTFSVDQMLRDSIISEIEAISLYDAQISELKNSSDPFVLQTICSVLSEIRDEEIAHVGELTKLFSMLHPDIELSLDKGVKEVEQKIKEYNL